MWRDLLSWCGSAWAGSPGWARRVRGFVVVVCCLGVLAGVTASARAASTLRAYADGTGTTTGCPQTTPSSNGCSLQQALSTAQAGDTIELASPGASAGGANYVGNWTIGTAGTSAGAPITIDGGGVIGATLDGNNGGATGCSTSACGGAVLSVGSGRFVVLKGLTIQNANDPGKGGG